MDLLCYEDGTPRCDANTALAEPFATSEPAAQQADAHLVESLPVACQEDHTARLRELLKVEASQMPAGSYLDIQPFFQSRHRFFLVQWMHVACYQLNLSLSAFAIAVRLLDRFLEQRMFEEADIQQAQCAAVACLSIAAKVDGPDNKLPRSVADYQVETELWRVRFSAKAIADMELQVLEALDWRSMCSTAVDFLDRLLCLVHLGRDKEGNLIDPALAYGIRNAAQNAIFDMLFEANSIVMEPSCIAAAAILHGMQSHCSLNHMEAVSACFAAYLDQDGVRQCLNSFLNNYGPAAGACTVADISAEEACQPSPSRMRAAKRIPSSATISSGCSSKDDYSPTSVLLKDLDGCSVWSDY